MTIPVLNAVVYAAIGAIALSAASPAVPSMDGWKVDRCPICRTAIYKHPRWIATIYYEENGHLRHLAFDGVKEMLRFLYHPERWGYSKNFAKHVKRLVVRDFETRKPIWAKKAWYVVGGDLRGPHGVALIPFGSREQAQDFKVRHRGLRVLRFEQLTPALIDRLAEEGGRDNR